MGRHGPAKDERSPTIDRETPWIRHKNNPFDEACSQDGSGPALSTDGSVCKNTGAEYHIAVQRATLAGLPFGAIATAREDPNQAAIPEFVRRE